VTVGARRNKGPAHTGSLRREWSGAFTVMLVLLLLAAAPAHGDAAIVIERVQVEALDVTVLKGSGQAVIDWCTHNGFLVSSEIKDHLLRYASSSPVFMAAKYNTSLALQRHQQSGDGVPLLITMRTPHLWVPLEILATDGVPVNADLFLLTDGPLRTANGVAVTSRLTDAMIGTVRCSWLNASRAAKTAAFTSRMSCAVSMIRQSLPPSTSPSACSVKELTSSENVMLPRVGSVDAGRKPVGPMLPTTNRGCAGVEYSSQSRRASPAAAALSSRRTWKMRCSIVTSESVAST